MSRGKLDHSAYQPVKVKTHQTELILASNQVMIRKNGIAFLSATALPVWAEVSVDLRPPQGERLVCRNGVVVDCAGNRHSGYVVSVMFMGLSRQAQQQLDCLARPQSL
jgi:hypothetical protein